MTFLLWCFLYAAVCGPVCSAPAEEVKENRKYIIVIDAGSTGSRIHVYPYIKASPIPKFMPQDEFTLKRTPGLSSFEKTPENAGASLNDILSEAKEHLRSLDIKDNAISRIPIFLVATAGLRKVAERSQEAVEKILDSVRATLSKSGFRFSNDWARVITGIDEGLYGWVTVNYLLDNFQDGSKKTVGVLEMGGESVQITYMPDPWIENNNMLQDIRIAEKTYSVFTHSWMGYGMQAAQAKLDAANTNEAESPCYLKGAVRESIDGTQKWSGTGNWEACYYSLKFLIREAMLDSKCTPTETYQCAPDGLPIPKIDTEEFYFIENFWYTAKVLGLTEPKGAEYWGQMKTLGTKYCGKAYSDAKQWLVKQSGKEPYDDEVDKECFCTAYINALLKEGFDLEKFKNYKVVRNVAGSDLDWALGYAISMEAGGAALEGGKTNWIYWVFIILIVAIIGYVCWQRRRQSESQNRARYTRISGLKKDIERSPLVRKDDKAGLKRRLSPKISQKSSAAVH